MTGHNKPTQKLIWDWVDPNDKNKPRPQHTPSLSSHHSLANIDDAITNLGREIGRIGTALETTTDPNQLYHFMKIYTNCLTRYVDLLFKQKALDANAGLPKIIEDALDALNKEFELEL